MASRNKWARIETLLRNRAFVMEYAITRDRWRNGIPAVFPAGTYWLQRFASVTAICQLGRQAIDALYGASRADLPLVVLKINPVGVFPDSD